MRSYFLCFGFLIVTYLSIPFFGYSQKNLQSKVDSLSTLLTELEPSRDKCEVYYRLYGLYLYQDMKKAEAYLDQGFAMAKDINDRRALILAYDKYGGIAMVRSDYPAAIKNFKLADSLLQYEDWPNEKTLVYGNFAAIYKDMGQYDKSLEWTERFIELAVDINNQGFEAFGYSLTGDIYQVKGQNELAAMNYLKALRIYEKQNDPARLADAFRALGASQTAFLNFQDAQENLSKAIPIYQDLNDQFYLAQAYRDLGYNYFLQDSLEQARDYYRKALFVSEQYEETWGVAEAQSNLGEIALAQGDIQKSRDLFEEAQVQYKAIGNPLDIGLQLRFIGDTYLAEKNYTAALNNYQSAFQILDTLNVPIALQNLHKGFYQTYEALGNTNQALQAYKEYATISDSLFTVEKATRLEELQLIYDVEKKDQEIALLSKDVALGRLRTQALILGGIAVLFIAGLIIYMQITRRKKEQKLSQERHRNQQLEIEKQQLEKEQLERELATQVLQLCRKNEILASVQQEVEDLNRPGGSASKNLSRLNRTIEHSLNSDEDWAQFLSTFEKVHPDFLNHLQQSDGRLSPAEQRLACLLRMNLSSKDIATLLNISDQGVKKARYRLRKKLNLDSDINLQSYLLNFQWKETANS